MIPKLVCKFHLLYEIFPSFTLATNPIERYFRVSEAEWWFLGERASIVFDMSRANRSADNNSNLGIVCLYEVLHESWIQQTDVDATACLNS